MNIHQIHQRCRWKTQYNPVKGESDESNLMKSEGMGEIFIINGLHFNKIESHSWKRRKTRWNPTKPSWAHYNPVNIRNIHQRCRWKTQYNPVKGESDESNLMASEEMGEIFARLAGKQRQPLASHWGGAWWLMMRKWSSRCTILKSLPATGRPPIPLGRRWNLFACVLLVFCFSFLFFFYFFIIILSFFFRSFFGAISSTLFPLRRNRPFGGPRSVEFTTFVFHFV